MTEQTPPTSTAGHSHVDALKPGERLAEFEIVELLGVGGFGMVYKAFDHSLHRSVAIKEYMPSALVGRMQGQALSIRSSADQSTYQAGLVSFVEEARLLAQFDHPSLVKVFRFWEANNTAYMVMPLYSGMTFKQARAQMRTPPPELWLRQVLWSVLSALRVLHDAKMLHRDISPDNIFLQYSGPPVLLDLGAARHAINDQHQRNTAVLKVNYAPIEQYAEGDDQLPQGPWSDIYSLAAVIHGCLCNDTPLPATLRAIRDRMVPLPRVAKTIKTQFGVRYSTPFITALQQSLAIRPEDRPQSIDALLETMEMMTPPAGIQQFDFRSDLGHVWVEPADQPVPGLEPTTVDVATAARILADAKVEHARASEPISDQAAIDGHTQSNATDNPDTVFVEY
jgi:serine/threonine protein kinase